MAHSVAFSSLSVGSVRPARASDLAAPRARLPVPGNGLGQRSSGLLSAVTIGAGVSLVASRLSRRRQGLRGAAAREALVFIDGEAGTTGLQVRERLAKHPGIEVLSLEPGLRKDENARRDALHKADAAVLCLPDDAAIAAVALAEGSDTVIVDASTAYRIADGWAYGFPELSASQAGLISKSKRISNPGCYPTGFIGLTRPLVDAGLLLPDAALVVPAVSGYSGGGKGLIDIYEGSGAHEPWGAYGFGLNHKHLAEMSKWTGLQQEPIFCPAVGNFKQGMVVSVPLRMSQLKPGTSAADVQAALAKHYEGKQFVSVAPLNPTDVLERGAFLRPDALNNTNKLELFCFANE
ncbi:unnamed protein product, partial [Polarella glacialis]